MALTSLDKLENKYSEEDLRSAGLYERRLILKEMGFTELQTNRLVDEEGMLDEFLDNPYEFIGILQHFTLKDADALRKFFNLEEEELAISGQLPDRDEGVVLNYLYKYSRPEKESYIEADYFKTVLAKQGVSIDRTEHAIHSLVEKERVCLRNFGDEEQVFLYDTDRDEEIVADKLVAMVEKPPKYNRAEVNILTSTVGDNVGMKLTEEQQRAIECALEKPVSIITGGPGTGKTSIILALHDLLNKAGEKVELCAFTGRAAKRIHEATGLNAKTIHRLLEATYDEESYSTFFARNADNKLDVDAVIVDEASMVGLDLFARLLEALSDEARLIIVGDEKQLPPVNSGCVFQDLIKTELIPVNELTEVHRQKEGSEILDFSHRIRRLDDMDSGKHLAQELAENYGGELVFCEKRDNKAVVAEVLELMYSLLSDEEVDWTQVMMNSQVILPLRKPTENDGGLNTYEMNKLLQMSFNPFEYKPSVVDRASKTVFRLDDKVIHIKNNYSLPIYNDDGEECDAGVFNGEVGMVTDVDEEGSVAVRYDIDRNVSYDADTLEELELAYALTVHKAQGSEVDKVLFALPTKISRYNRMLLQRNLFYTGLTRAKNRAWIIGSKNIVASAIKMTSKEWKSCISARLQERISLGE